MDTSSELSQLSEIDIVKYLKTSTVQGLSSIEVLERQEKFGLNTLRTRQLVTKWIILVQQLKSIIVLLLFTSAILSFVLNQWVEGMAIVVVLVVNTLIGFVTEFKAIRSMEALRSLGRRKTVVVRNNEVSSIDATGLVPGDVVLFEAGDVITADIRLIEASKVTADEAALTGESFPVEKRLGAISEDAILAEQANMLFKGTSVVRGSGRGIVVATGMKTELGRIAKLTEESKEELTPLEKRLDKLGQYLVWVSLAMASLIAITGTLAGKNIWLMFETSVALAVATIPEGLPIVATMALARGMWRMAKKNALVNRLSAVETLGATSIIFTDKTGTLTENKMTVRLIFTNQKYSKINASNKLEDLSHSLERCFEIASLCNNASIAKSELSNFVGDPMEVALLKAGEASGIVRDSISLQYPRLKEEAFDTETRMMATYHRRGKKVFIAVKGAPEQVLKVCDSVMEDDEVKSLTSNSRDFLLEKNREIAADGLRVLALAYKEVESTEAEPYTRLVFAGLVGLIDPARKEVKSAIESCRAAGIRVVMVTGDQGGTASKIARDISLVDDLDPKVIRGDELGDKQFWTEELKSRIQKTSIFSRVSPQQKLDLIEFYQNQKAIVAMTGDGINDAPALKKADIGIAMGLRGTQVAKEAADMILKDDKFNTIVLAVKQGRIIFSNIKRFVIYLLSCNISEILIIAIATLVNAPLPLLPLQILFLNLVTDVFPALALGMGDGGEDFLNYPPRKSDEPIITIQNWRRIGGYGLLITASVLAAFFFGLYYRGSSLESALTISFLTLGFSQVFHVFNMRQVQSNMLNNDITRNPYVWGAVFLCTVLLVGAVFVPKVNEALNLMRPAIEEWFLIVGFSLVPLVVGQLLMTISIPETAKWRF